jgi:hypothetical protein
MHGVQLDVGLSLDGGCEGFPARSCDRGFRRGSCSVQSPLAANESFPDTRKVRSKHRYRLFNSVQINLAEQST